MGTQPTNHVDEGRTTKERAASPKMIIIAALLLIVVGTAGFVAYQQYQAAKVEAARLEDAYQKAISAKETGNYETAVNLFEELGDYKDSPDMIQECRDAQSLEYLQTLYQVIDTIYQTDNKLVNMFSTIMSNVEKINSAGTKLQATPRLVIDSLYSGQGRGAAAQCSGFELASIQVYFPSAQVSTGRMYYDVYIPLFSTEDAQTFVNSIEYGNTLIEDLEEAINTENLSDIYQKIQEQLLVTYEALKDYHSFVANKPTDYENYKATATEKKTAVSGLLNNLPSTVKARN